jgi:hypothetical protein
MSFCNVFECFIQKELKWCYYFITKDQRMTMAMDANKQKALDIAIKQIDKHLEKGR